MGRPEDGDRRDSKTGSGTHGPRRTQRRRRSVLNLGIPFAQVDDLLNQTEDAVAIGYRVLEQTVEEIKKGFQQAQEFNEKQRAWDGQGPAPPVPWEQIVERVQGLQNIAFQAMQDGTEIFLDSMRSGTSSMKSVAKTFEQSRNDVASNPSLAGPVFEDLLKTSVHIGEHGRLQKEIRHRGLARLRVHVAVDPELKQLKRTDDKSVHPLPTLKVKSVDFAPKPENSQELSELVLDLGVIPSDQPPGEYDGLVRATNFELLIAKVRVTIEPAVTATGSGDARAAQTRAARGRQRR